MSAKPRFKEYDHPAGGWGSVHSLLRFGGHPSVPTAEAMEQLGRQNKADGFMCVSCAWAKPRDPHRFEFCENGAKATFWELDRNRVDAGFFAGHTVSDLLQWADHDLERQGRLTEPMRYDHGSDCYVPIGWDEAFALIGRELRALEPDSAVFYASGRASLETSYMYALLARLYGTNNLPDSSNMCHESTSVGLPRSIGVPVGTVLLEDFEKTDCILAFGQNVGTNSPRMLHQLQEASRREVPILVFNPLRERGWERFTNPQEPGQMLTGGSTRIGSAYYQMRAGGDIAVVQGMCKALLELDEAAQRAGAPRVLDIAFIQTHTSGFDAFAASVRDTAWGDIERVSGMARADIVAAAEVYARAESTILVYGMGITQHRHGVDSVRMLCNLLLMRGNIGRPGAGICPVRGHSNVQGQRTVGISEKPELVPLDRLAQQYAFLPPRTKGLDTVGTVAGVLDGSVRAFIGLGGNFVRAAPETARLENAWRRLRLSVQVATKLNRSHLVCGEVTLLLPCLGRLERDTQASGDQTVTTEDSTTCIHASFGTHDPAADTLLSEPAIVAGIARATLPDNPNIPWQAWVDDYARVRDAIEATYPDQFRDFNARLKTPGGFPRPVAARERRWETDSGKAGFMVPTTLDASGIDEAPERLRLVTVRSNDQFNTTIYGYRDRFRGIDGTRRVVMLCDEDMRRLGLTEGELVDLVGDYDDGVERAVGGLRVTRMDLPPGCIAGYYPECNPLLANAHHAIDSHVPAGKSIPVRIRRGQQAPVPAGPSPVESDH
ncbi:FdhF/YdeP family oxidoreductase [Xanthomonas sp. XNM01]|uniref:FdhF/YdeP family oxidoreductase n=1 Tax=Xanthomonas sp. XNM01 TaxID=2769289 RepID=UPI00178692EC|nr:FdhF/YdeP family oxidoreductase [Xanthomonas sp. XNM01]MBD9367244.1 FdhF/YdeP family oxidoreductase [Xanthomonas sp. XNM01]